MRYNTTVNTEVKNAFFIGIFALTSSFFAVPGVSFAQTMQCDTPAQKAACQAALNQAEADEAAAQAQLQQAQGKSASLSQAIAVLTAKINAAEADIKAKNILIQTLGSDIQDKQAHITDLEGHIAAGKQSLADLLRKTNELDAYSLPEVMLSRSTVAGFFNDIDTFQSIQTALESTFYQLQSDEASTSAEKDALTVRQNATMDARYAIQEQEASIKGDQAEQKQLLSISKGNEAAYTALVNQKTAEAAQIRAALFPLAGGQKIPFGQALQYAQAASAKTGVRPAFILAILTNESALGGNVGNCYLTNQQTGDGVFASTGLPSASVMKPTRDVQPFLQITQALSLDPSRTVVSCQQVSVGGWGGAMGPAQFIPSTWMLMKDDIASLLGMSGMPNPWNPAHAFMASALYLSNLGANIGGYTAERNAACKYFGGVCSKSRAIASYGDNAIAKAAQIQAEINQL